MRGVAISDVHLGIKQGTKTWRGANVRQNDVSHTWMGVCSEVRRNLPGRIDVITIAGDLVHSVHVDDDARCAMIQGLLDLSVRAEVVVVAGNHDHGRTATAPSPLDLIEVVPWPNHQVHLVKHAPNLVRLKNGANVFGIPAGMVQRGLPLLEADVVVAHEPVKSDKVNKFYAAGAEHTPDELLDIGKVLHLGDYHEFVDFSDEMQDGRLAFYSGATDLTTSDVFGETYDKGYVLWSTCPADVVRCVTAPRNRKNHDLKWDGDINNLNMWLERLAAPNRGNPPMVRVRIMGLPREERHGIDWTHIKELKRKSTVFKLDIKYAETDAPAALEDRRESSQTMLAALREHVKPEPPQVQDIVIDAVKGEMT